MNGADTLPVLYSFGRCPYAMRARLALAASGQPYALREVVLRDKPAELLAASPKGTVPVLVLPDGKVIDQSLDVMLWALQRHDPQSWLAPERGTLDDMLAVVAGNDGAFKHSLAATNTPTATPQNRQAMRKPLPNTIGQKAAAGWCRLKSGWAQVGYAVNAPASPTWRCCLLCASSPIPTPSGLLRSPGLGWPAGSPRLRRAACSWV